MSFRANAIEKQKNIYYTCASNREKDYQKQKEDIEMAKIKNLYYQSAILFSALLSAVLFVSANSTSCFMVYQPKAPEALSRYSKFE